MYIFIYVYTYKHILKMRISFQYKLHLPCTPVMSRKNEDRQKMQIKWKQEGRIQEKKCLTKPILQTEKNMITI